MTDMVTYGLTGGVAVITLNRPDALNALSPEMLDALDSALGRAHGDEGARAVVITGAGRAFCAGADIRHFATLSPAGVQEYAGRAIEVFRHIEEMGKPVIAAINGHALGGGFEMALSCMIRMASEQAALGLPEVKIGAVAGGGGTTRLPRIIGLGRAAELLLTGRTMDAHEAERIGLVSRVTAHDALMSEAMALAEELAALPRAAVRLTWEALRTGMDLPIDESLTLGADHLGMAAADEDFREGTCAFMEKRPPRYR
jgi:enoyl-CoA hydratase